ncbi:MAG: hypothetical protein AAGF24_04080 [Cyanobacteria bacterium P01_H01_bin.121]
MSRRPRSLTLPASLRHRSTWCEPASTSWVALATAEQTKNRSMLLQSRQAVIRPLTTLRQLVASLQMGTPALSGLPSVD